MYCNQCGTQLASQQAFCPTCGRAVAAVAYDPAAARVSEHVRTLAVFWFVVGALWAIPAIVMFSLGTAAGVAIHAPEAPFLRWGGALLFYALGGFFAAVATGSFAAAWGLLKLRPWARVLALVLGFISLLHPPFGTALGIYTLWVLLPGGAAAEYDRLSH